MDPETAQQDEDDLEYASSSPPSSTQTSTLTWITWFTSLPGHEYFCEVAEEFIEDDFNLTGLQTMVPFWKEALEMVLDVEPEEDSLKIPDVSIVESSAELLYGLVHQRYILTRQGLQAMVNKTFGACPRVYCHATSVIPCGRSDQPGLDTVKLYCPNCGDIYSPPSSRFQGVDGAFFGTTFPHLFYQTYRELFPAPFFNPSASSRPSNSSDNAPSSSSSNSSSAATPNTTNTTNAASTSNPPQPFRNPDPHGGQKAAYGEVYEKKIYGFKVSERARSGPRMMWLRQRPTSLEELARVDWRGRWIDDGKGADGDMDDGKGRGTGGTGDLFEGNDEEEGEEGESEEEEEEAPPAQSSTVKTHALALGPLSSPQPHPDPDRTPLLSASLSSSQPDPVHLPISRSDLPLFFQPQPLLTSSQFNSDESDSDSSDAAKTPAEKPPSFFALRSSITGKKTLLSKSRQVATGGKTRPAAASVGGEEDATRASEILSRMMEGEEGAGRLMLVGREERS